ncbi:MAG: response regulator [Rhodospirillaceae bacterium]|nr:response regulator [Rhodospirillaceae bacterium]
MRPYKILIVDDVPENLHLMRNILSDQYKLVFATDGEKAVAAAEKHHPDLILMDVMMPNMDGYEACRQIKQDPKLCAIPVIFVTAMGELSDEMLGFDIGGVDYITKPIKAPVLKRRVQTHLSLVRVEELEKTRLRVIERLGRAAEFKDNETGLHVIRMARYAKMIAERSDVDPEWAQQLFLAAPMHDLGKIGIPDSIIMKPGPLNSEEWDCMKKHPEIGAEIIGYTESGLLQMAREIALSHHEKWDGSGYPQGLVGEAIPLSARIVAVADVFDALMTKRPYKKAWPVEDVLAYVKDASGTHLDPKVVALFLGGLDVVFQIIEAWGEESGASLNGDE